MTRRTPANVRGPIRVNRPTVPGDGFLLSSAKHTELVFPTGSINSPDNGLNDGRTVVGTSQDAENVSTVT